MLITSLPSAIWCISTSSPPCTALFFSAMISRARRSIMSTFRFKRWTCASGHKSSSARLNHAGPRNRRTGRMIVAYSASLIDGLCMRVREQESVEESERRGFALTHTKDLTDSVNASLESATSGSKLWPSRPWPTSSSATRPIQLAISSVSIPVRTRSSMALSSCSCSC